MSSDDTDAVNPLVPGARQGPTRSIVCDGCGQQWSIPAGLHGISLRCRICTQMIALPATPAATGASPILPAAARPEAPAPTRRGVQAIGRDGQLPVRAALPGPGPAADGDTGLLQEAPVAVRAAWTSRAATEVALIMAAFWGPAVAVYVFTAGEQEIAFMPLVGLLSGLLVLLISFSAPAYAFGAMRAPAVRHIGEALLVIPLLALLGHGYMELITAMAPEFYDPSWLTGLAQSGWLTLVFVLAICPGVFEEIAFRGILQSRLSALYGLRLGGIYAAVAFGLAHTVTVAIPIHFLLGFYLVSLRIRSASLLPGMLVHIGYNTAVVWLHLTFLDG